MAGGYFSIMVLDGTGARAKIDIAKGWTGRIRLEEGLFDMNRSLGAKVIPLRDGGVADDDGVSQGLAAGNKVYRAEPRLFPLVSTLPRLPMMIPDEILDYYGWVFCQGGFLNLQMTFEQFLAVVAAISPSGLCPEYDASEASYPGD